MAYDSELTKVESVALEVARQVQQRTPEAAPDFTPLLRFHTFADSSINCAVSLRAKDFTASKIVQHEFIKALHARFRQEGINIPYPVRTLEIKRHRALR